MGGMDFEGFSGAGGNGMHMNVDPNEIFSMFFGGSSGGGGMGGF